MATKTTSLLSGLSENFSRKELFGNYGFLYSLIFCLTPSILNLFFAHPNASWQRGVNENTNGLIRQYFPKSCSLVNVNRNKCDYVMKKLNNRPRKKIGFKTPFEVFFKRKTNLIKNVALTN